jgi:hypothetical protein
MILDQDIQEFLEKSSTYMDINALGPDWEEYFVRAIRKIKNEEAKNGFGEALRKRCSAIFQLASTRKQPAGISTLNRSSSNI